MKFVGGDIVPPADVGEVTAKLKDADALLIVHLSGHGGDAPGTVPKTPRSPRPPGKGKQQGVAGPLMALRHPAFHAASVRPRASSAERSFQSMLMIPGKYRSRVSPLTRSSAASISAVNSPSARCRLVL